MTRAEVGQRVKIVGLNSIGDPAFLGRVGVVERTRDGMHLIQVPGLGSDEFYPSELRVVRELPLLYSAPMVLACLAGLKTQTRRIPPRKLWGDIEAMLAWGQARYGEPGDVLYVREAWRATASEDAYPPSRLPHGLPIRYEADGEIRSRVRLLRDDTFGKQRPGIHMPKWASRIRRLRTEPLRVERVQDMSDADIAAEAVTPSLVASLVRDYDLATSTPRYAFWRGWDHINGKRAPWAENPPVIVVSHEAHQAEEARAA
jgi:hypothetical protein